MVRNATWILALLLHVFCSAVQLHAQTPGLHWANTISGATGVSEVYDIVIDPAGFVYVTGSFVGTADFDPGAGVFSATSPNSIWYSYIQKLDTNGNFIWAKIFTCNDINWGISLALDPSGNVIASGYFSGTADFDPGVGVANLSSVGLIDMYVVKLNSAGAYQWSKRTGAAGRECVPYMLKTDAAGAVYNVGIFDGPMDFNPGGATFNMSPTGLHDVFIQKLDAAGNFVYAKRFGGGDYESPETVNIDAAGNIYTSGSFFSSTVDFDPNAGTVNVALLGSEDFFIQKLNSAGNFVSVARLGGAGASVWGQSALDPAGNIFSAGMMSGTVDFDPGAGVFNLSSGAQTHAFVHKLNSSNVLQWVKQISCTGGMANRSITTDVNGNVYLVGDFDGVADFDPGAGVVSRSSAVTITYILKLDPAGNFVWVAVFNSSGYVFSDALVTDPHTNVYSGGYHNGTSDFDPQATSFFLTSDDDDEWLLKLRQWGGPLPANELNLTATALPIEVDLGWQWAVEGWVTQAFEVERSVDGVSFASIGEVVAGNATEYGYQDRNVVAGGHYWYRLRRYDYNGGSSYSAVVEATVPSGTSIQGIFPNPASDGSVTFWSQEPVAEVSICNVMGQTMIRQAVDGKASVRLDVHELSPGWYWVKGGQGQPLPLQIR